MKKTKTQRQQKTKKKQKKQQQQKQRTNRNSESRPAVGIAEAVRHLGVGIDTARYGHHVSFLREDKQPAAPPLAISESRGGYEQLRGRLEQLHRRHAEAHMHLRIDAAGQYAANLEAFVRSLELPLTVSVGEPKRNKDYHRAHSPKRKNDASESLAMARYAVVERPHESFGKPPEFAALRRVAARLQSQTRQTTRLTNQLHETLSAAFPELATITGDITTGWVLELLKKYPTAPRIAAARIDSLESIPFLKPQMARQVRDAAKTSVGTLCGDVAEELIRELAAELRHSLAEEKRWKQLLEKAFDALPDGPQRMIETIKGIGKMTAAAIVATAVSSERFETAKHLIGYDGVFPEEFQSGVDKFGRPIPPGKKIMCRKGNDLVRGLLWNCAKCASAANGGNPAVRALYLRRRAAGDTPQVAWGYCMTKLLRQVYGVWISGAEFDPQHEAKKNTGAAGHKQHCCSVDQEVTAAPASVEPVPHAAPSAEAASPRASHSDRPAAPEQPTCQRPADQRIDFHALRQQVTFAQVLTHLNLGGRHSGSQYRGACPLHETHNTKTRGRSFSANLKRNVFRCFDSSCGRQGNVLDFWAAYHQLDLYQAAVHLAATFGVEIPPLDPERKQTQTKRGITPPNA